MVQFTSKRPPFEYLRNKWTVRERVSKDNFWNKHGESLKQLALGSLGGLLLISAPSSHPAPFHLTVSREGLLENFD